MDLSYFWFCTNYRVFTYISLNSEYVWKEFLGYKFLIIYYNIEYSIINNQKLLKLVIYTFLSQSKLRIKKCILFYFLITINL